MSVRQDCRSLPPPRRRRRARGRRVRACVPASADNGAAPAVPPLSFAARARSRSMIAVVACGRRCFVGRAVGRTAKFPAVGENERTADTHSRAKGAQSGIGLRRGHTGSEQRGREGGREVYLIRAVLTIDPRGSEQRPLLYRQHRQPTTDRPTGIPERAQVCREIPDQRRRFALAALEPSGNICALTVLSPSTLPAVSL